MNDIAKETIASNLEQEMRQSYLDYAMSVIVAVSYTHLTLPTKA